MACIKEKMMESEYPPPVDMGPTIIGEPRLIPGYSGHVPSYRQKFGKSYGKITSDLFLDPSVPISPQTTILVDMCEDGCKNDAFLQRELGFRTGSHPHFRACRPIPSGCSRLCVQVHQLNLDKYQLLPKEKELLKDWCNNFKSKPWDRTGEPKRDDKFQSPSHPGNILYTEPERKNRCGGSGRFGYESGPWPVNLITFNDGGNTPRCGSLLLDGN